MILIEQTLVVKQGMFEKINFEKIILCQYIL